MNHRRFYAYQFPYCIYPVVILLLTIRASSSAPSTNVIALESAGGSGFNPISYMTSKAMGIVIRTISYVYQWLPRIPEWMRPDKPTLTLVRPIDTRLRDDFSSEEYDDCR